MGNGEKAHCDRSSLDDQRLDIRSPFNARRMQQHTCKVKRLKHTPKAWRRSLSVSSEFSCRLCLHEFDAKWFRKATNISLMPPMRITTSVLTPTCKCAHNCTYVSYSLKKNEESSELWCKSKSVYIHYSQNDICLRWNSTDQFTQDDLTVNHRHPVQNIFKWPGQLKKVKIH